jgi:ubiquinone/menaquinone biosynthesis C-methylase UbiE
LTFARLAPRYERFRPVTRGDERRLRFLLDRCPVPAGGSVLEVGCGTGRLLKAMNRLVPLGRVAGVDPESEMLARAAPLEVHLGRAERLQLESGAFDLAFLWLAFHLVNEKRAAAAELWRVVRDGGHAAIWTLTPEHVRGFHLNPYFPSLPSVDLPRFEAPESWMLLLAEAGFEPVLEQELRLKRATTARRLATAVRERYLSTFDLLPPDELEAGTRRLEEEAARNAGRRITYEQRWCLVWGRK